MNTPCLHPLPPLRTLALGILTLAAIPAILPTSAHGQILYGYGLNIGISNTVSSTHNAAIGASNYSMGWGVLSLGDSNINEAGAHHSLLAGYGNYTPSGAYYSAVFGSQNTLNASNSLAVGVGNHSRGNAGLLVGRENAMTDIAGSGVFPSMSAAVGMQNTLKGGTANLASGKLCVVEDARFSSTFGYGLENTFDYTCTVGRYNDGSVFDASNTPLFVVGNGTDNMEGRANAFAVFENGDVSASGVIRIQPAGDIPMGQFTNGPQ